MLQGLFRHTCWKENHDGQSLCCQRNDPDKATRYGGDQRNEDGASLDDRKCHYQLGARIEYLEKLRGYQRWYFYTSWWNRK